MAREKLKDFLRTRGGGDMLNFVVEDGGDQSYDPGIDDLGVDNVSGKQLRPLLRDFLADVTKRNDYPISAGGEEIVLTTPEGDPAPLQAAESTGADRVFVRSNKLQEYSDSGKLTRFTGPAGFVDKARGKGGNELLPGVKGTGLDRTQDTQVDTTSGDRIPSVVESSLKVENRYNPSQGGQFVPRGTTSSRMDEKGNIIPVDAGVFDLQGGKQVTFDELRKIGTSLLLKAAQIDTADKPSKSIKVDKAGNLSKEAYSPTSVFNASSRVDARLLDPTRADGSSDALVGRNRDFLDTSGDEKRTSYGTMNSPITPFDAPLPLGMIAQAALGIGVVGGATIALTTVLSLIPGERRENPVRGPQIAGRSDVPTTMGAYAEMIGVTPGMFGMIPTNNPYIDCVKAGVLSFFGGGGGGLESVSGLAGSILQSPGYYVVIIRAILSSIEQIKAAFAGFGGGGGALGNIDAAANLINVLKRSKFIGYLNALAAIGDVALTNAPTGFSLSAASFGIADKPNPPAVIPSNRVTMSREGASPQSLLSPTPDLANVFIGPSGRLTWRMGSAAAAYLIPRTIFTGELGMSPTEKAVMHTELRDKTMLNDVGRLPSQIVQDIEAYLDAEYVPFYFHDLRTNEIIAFHAFLDSLDDSYNIGRNTENAFGRMDQVLVHQGTTRSISLSFTIAATSESDFDEMWYRVNKLVTLAYPQWTAGDEITGAAREGGWSPTYKVPFSQVVGASPIIRLRVGDVIASNYSKFGLSRFFGATDKETKLSQKMPGSPRGNNARKTRFNSDSRDGKKQDDRFHPPEAEGSRGFAKIEEKVTTLPVFLKPSMGKNYTLEDGLSKIPLKTSFPIRGTIDSLSFGKSLIDQSATDGLKGLASDAHPLLYTKVTITDDRYSELMGKTVIATPADLMVDPDLAPHVALADGLESTFPDQNLKGEGFFDAKNNAVVRAFESTRGKGLAGMLSSIKFTWLDGNATWEISRGSRAPILCKVSIGMDVIHDLPVGLAHDGFMIAPSYPVGNINRKFFGSPYTSPNELNLVPVVPGNEALSKTSRDPLTLNASAPSPTDIAKSAAKLTT